ncbi:DUF2690 domain-containing protein [Micromonospora sp. D93]|uniref:DUF2690 domain-containing protein n=1 Tax=Micromonospora sp. D93 TaxID=2824886 RepID=UPI001B381A9B|nr:DUF2690 domain-containing protein [Micromonospora sp. D93]MBQ1018857.1 DUF2690 domain-containing protein [Micromonospora sp. D93]
MKRLLLTSGLTLGALALSILAGPVPAQAAPPGAASTADVDAVVAAGEGIRIDARTLAASGCGSSCDGKDPYFKIYYNGNSYYKCSDDAQTIYGVKNSSGSVELRYSPRCRTAWAKTAASDVVFKVVSRYTNGNYRTSMSAYGPDGYTNMVNDAGLEAQACFDPTGPGEGWTCTGWW